MSNQDNKCAPNKNYSEGSCFTLEDLKKMAISFNKFVEKGEIKSDKIEIKDEKKHLLYALTTRLEGICDNQICWLKQNFVKHMKDKDILKHSFRCVGEPTETNSSPKYLSVSIHSRTARLHSRVSLSEDTIICSMLSLCWS